MDAPTGDRHEPDRGLARATERRERLRRLHDYLRERRSQEYAEAPWAFGT